MTDQCTQTEAQGIRVITCPRHGLTETFVAVPQDNGRAPADVFQRLDACFLNQASTQVVRQSMFGLVNGTAKAHKPARTAAWPVTRITDGTGVGHAIAGGHLHAITGTNVSTIRGGGRIIGTVFEDAYARYCLLGDLRPDNPALSREEQARFTFEMMESSLRLVSMDFSHVVRTWLFVDNILAWYGPFNKVRDAFFKERGVYDRLVPASTGVGGGNPAGTALVAELLAVQVKDPRVHIQPVASPLQCPALQYGSSFSRAVEIAAPDHTRLLVSGTASIEPGGATAFVGDVDKQVDLTMRVVAAILESRGMNWSHVSRAIAYFKHTQDVPSFARYCAAHKLPPLPVVIAKADICRDDLLFELEADALRCNP